MNAHLVSSQGAGDGQLLSQESFEALADWVSSLHGRGDISSALGRLSRLLGASRACIFRHKGAASREIVGIGLGDLTRSSPGGSLSWEILGDVIAGMQHSKVWTLSNDGSEATFVEKQWLHQRMQDAGTFDLSMIVLGTADESVDYCELRFPQEVPRRDGARLRAMAPAMAKAWNGRLPGTVEKLLAQRRRMTGFYNDPVAVRDLLSPANPAGLSRSEYRICMLVQEGLVARSIAETLGVCESTVRSHLGSIYAKTGTSGHVDLLFQLTRSSASQEPSQRLSA